MPLARRKEQVRPLTAALPPVLPAQEPPAPLPAQDPRRWRGPALACLSLRKAALWWSDVEARAGSGDPPSPAAAWSRRAEPSSEPGTRGRCPEGIQAKGHLSFAVLEGAPGKAAGSRLRDGRGRGEPRPPKHHPLPGRRGGAQGEGRFPSPFFLLIGRLAHAEPLRLKHPETSRVCGIYPFSRSHDFLHGPLQTRWDAASGGGGPPATSVPAPPQGHPSVQGRGEWQSD